MSDFDLSTAQPVSSSFDLSTAQPVAPHQMMDAIGGQVVPSNSAAAMAARSPVSQGAPLQLYNPFGENINTGAQLSADAQNYLAGAGKATTDILRGAGQDVGMVSRQDIADSRALDAPLMATGAGRAGYITGTIADLAPAAFIPGANTLAGAGAIGAATGFLQPSAGTGETLWNTGIGGLASPGALLAGRAVGAVAQGVKGTLEPLFQGGQQRVAARALQAFAGGPQAAADAANAIQSAGSILPGVEPMTAELANNAGLAQMERSLRNSSEYSTQLTARSQANRAAMTGALGNIARTDADMAAAVAARSNASAPLYDAASTATAPIDDEMTALLQRPSMQKAIVRAQQLAGENGDTFGIASTTQGFPMKLTGQDLQYLKMSLNDIVNTAEQKGMGAHESRAVTSTLGSLNGWIQKNVPALKAADSQFADLSAPINQMQVGQALSNKLLPALSDFGNNTRLNANSYAGAVRNGDALAANVTGQQNATLESTLNADQLRTVMQVGDQLARRSNADELGRAVGSNTGQNLISQNVLRQFLGPLGLPQSTVERAAQSAFGQSVLRPAQWLAQAGTPRVMDVLTQSALSPQFAGRLLQAGVDPGMAHMIWARQGLLGNLGSSLAESGFSGSGSNVAQQ